MPHVFSRLPAPVSSPQRPNHPAAQCTHYHCHGVNLFVRSRLLEICPSDLVNVQVAGLAVALQGVRVCTVCLCVETYCCHGWWDPHPCPSVFVCRFVTEEDRCILRYMRKSLSLFFLPRNSWSNCIIPLVQYERRYSNSAGR